MLASFSGPLLIIVGEEDAFAPLAEVEKLAAALNHTELITVPGADHFFMSGLSQVGRATADWISRTN
jgi:pimeloyl-ACP methyl ester carboxylesterase